MTKGVVLLIKVSKTNENGPLAAEQLFASIHGMLRKSSFFSHNSVLQDQVSFEIARYNGSIGFYVWTPIHTREFVEGQIYAQYPDIEIEEVSDYASRDVNSFACCELSLAKHYVFPIKRFKDFEDRIAGISIDTLSGITESLSNTKLGDGESISIQMVVKPIKDYWWQRVADKTTAALMKNKDIFLFQFIGSETLITTDLKWYARVIIFPFLPIIWVLNFFFNIFTSSGSSRASDGHRVQDEDELQSTSKTTDYFSAMTKGIVEKANKPAFETAIRIMYMSSARNSTHTAKQKVFSVSASFKQFHSAQLNGFTAKSYTSKDHLITYRRRLITQEKQFLNVEELATIYHLPNLQVKTPGIIWVTSRKFEPPANLPTWQNSPDTLTSLGVTNYRGHIEEFGILPDDRRRHIYIIGKTGMGKSTLLENMIYSDMITGKGVAVVDPHGELAEACLSYLPQNRAEDLIICDPSDGAYPVSINMLEDPGTSEARSLIASGLLGVFKKMFAESWGPRLEHVLRNTLLALAEYPDSNMLGIMRILVDDEYRTKVVNNVTDPVVRSFWEGEFANYAPRNIAEIISPIQNKVGQFLSSPIVRNIVGQTKSTINIREAMDTGKILIVNLSKGKVGEDNSALLGSMLITKFQLDAMSRANIAAEDRKDFYLYVDEFQNFATDSFATILSEARKYKLNLTMANQYIAQMSEIVRDAVFGNVGTIVTFQTGYDDAVYLSTQFSEVATPEDITSLNKYTIYNRLLVGGMPSQVFSAKTMPPPDKKVSNEMIKYYMDLSRYKYSASREAVEDAINKWSAHIQPVSKGDKKPSQKEKMAPSFDVTTLSPGQTLKTNVVGKADYGLFLSFQGAEGLLHMNKIPKDKRSIISTMEKGDLLEVQVLEIMENSKLSFTLLPVNTKEGSNKKDEEMKETSNNPSKQKNLTAEKSKKKA